MTNQQKTHVQLQKEENLKYKTRLCRNYKDQGYCPFQHKCIFAHGQHELRQDVTRPVKFKTVPCTGFHGDSHFCRYGEKCSFLHNETTKVKKYIQVPIRPILHGVYTESN